MKTADIPTTDTDTLQARAEKLSRPADELTGREKIEANYISYELEQRGAKR